jgi:hypothetical protein
MGREFRRLSVAFTVHKPERLPLLPDGEHMDADDVANEISGVIKEALTAWYATRGKDLLACEPTT